jgi:hypothetical protein
VRKLDLPEIGGPLTKSDSVAKLVGGVAGGWIGMLLARILDRMWPMQESASMSRRLMFSNFSVYMTTSRTASESFLLASVDSAARASRSERALVRIWLAVVACSAEVADEVVNPGGYSQVSKNA